MNKMIKGLVLLAAGASVAWLVGCSSESEHRDPFAAHQVNKAIFGILPDGRQVDIYTLKSGKNTARIMTLGGVLVSLSVPDKTGMPGDIILGFDTLQEYVANPTTYFGALIGRYGNRIGKGQFALDGTTYHLDTNNNGNTLHGGAHGFSTQLWTATVPSSTSKSELKLDYFSKDGEMGFPGNLHVTAIYRLTDTELHIDFSAFTDKDTVVNLTGHSYFNLAGSGDILNHTLMIPSERITPVDAGLIPVGGYRMVTGTPFDFRAATKIGARINDDDSQLKLGPGYDHNFVLDKRPGQLTLAARASEPTSGRTLEVWSTEPSVQFYSGNFLNGIKGKNGQTYNIHDAFCLEPQHDPDAPNKPNFPSTELKPGQTYHTSIVYKFSAD
jgi:aldose 1-epimerase